MGYGCQLSKLGTWKPRPGWKTPWLRKTAKNALGTVYRGAWIMTWWLITPLNDWWSEKSHHCNVHNPNRRIFVEQNQVLSILAANFVGPSPLLKAEVPRTRPFGTLRNSPKIWAQSFAKKTVSERPSNRLRCTFRHSETPSLFHPEHCPKHPNLSLATEEELSHLPWQLSHKETTKGDFLRAWMVQCIGPKSLGERKT